MWTTSYQQEPFTIKALGPHLDSPELLSLCGHGGPRHRSLFTLLYSNLKCETVKSENLSVSDSGLGQSFLLSYFERWSILHVRSWYN